MKRGIPIVLLSFLLFGCEDVIEVSLPTAEPKLVIDAIFNTYINETPSRLEGSVKLSFTSDFLEGQISPANAAEVYLTNTISNTQYTFTEIGNSGQYTPENSSFIPIFDTTYELTINYNGETYQGNAQLIPSVPINSIVQGDGDLFGGNETEIIVEFTDDSSRTDFYLFDLDFDLFLTTEDEFYQGETFAFSYFYDELEGNEREIDVKLIGVSEQFYNYMNIIIEQSGQSGGGPFQTTPSTVRGNMINKTNPDNYPLGYFSLSETNNLSVTITE